MRKAIVLRFVRAALLFCLYFFTDARLAFSEDIRAERSAVATAVDWVSAVGSIDLTYDLIGKSKIGIPQTYERRRAIINFGTGEFLIQILRFSDESLKKPTELQVVRWDGTTQTSWSIPLSERVDPAGVMPDLTTLRGGIAEIRREAFVSEPLFWVFKDMSGHALLAALLHAALPEAKFSSENGNSIAETSVFRMVVDDHGYPRSIALNILGNNGELVTCRRLVFDQYSALADSTILFPAAITIEIFTPPEESPAGIYSLHILSVGTNSTKATTMDCKIPALNLPIGCRVHDFINNSHHTVSDRPSGE